MSTKDTKSKLDEEIEATENLIKEGDPFLLTRQDYLNNLKWIRGDNGN